MLPKVKTSVQKLEKYKQFLTRKQLEEINDLATPLKGLRVNFVNSTPRGGGVAEILKSLVPLMKGVGLKAEWYTIPGREDFFKITKEMHNALQGKKYDFPFSHRKRYLENAEKSAYLMQDMKADMWAIQDPQPAGVIQFLPHFHPSVCHLHIDLTKPNQEVWDFLTGFLEMYDKVVVSSKEFIKPVIKNKTIVFAPAIDPLMPKNQPFDPETAKQIIRSFGINPQKPLVTQVSRFDPWKDPLGVIRAYRMAKKEIPNLQLAMVGFFLAQDDPEAMKIFRMVEKEAKRDPDAFLFAYLDRLGSLKVDTFVNAIQVVSSAIIQNSVKEGFGLTVTEAMWKGKPVIGGNAAGIRTQIQNGLNGFITTNPKEMSEKIVEIVRNPEKAKKISMAAHSRVKQNFLLPRLLKDYLKLFNIIINSPKRSEGDESIIAMFTSY